MHDKSKEELIVALETAQQRIAHLERELANQTTTAQQEHQLLQDIVDNIPFIIFAKDLEGRYIVTNTAFYQAFNAPLDSYLGKTDYQIFPPDKANEIRTDDHRAIASGELIEFEEIVPHPDNSEHIYRTIKFPLHDDGGQLYGMGGIATDITSYRQLAKDLASSRRLAERILETSPNVIYIYDLINNVNTYSNQTIVDILGYTPIDLKTFGDQIQAKLVHPDDLADAVAHVKKLFKAKDGEVFELTYRMAHKNGSWRWVSDRITVFGRDETGRVTQYLGVLTDITDWGDHKGAPLHTQIFISDKL